MPRADDYSMYLDQDYTLLNSDMELFLNDIYNRLYLLQVLIVIQVPKSLSTTLVLIIITCELTLTATFTPFQSKLSNFFLVFGVIGLLKSAFSLNAFRVLISGIISIFYC